MFNPASVCLIVCLSAS